MHTDPKDNSPDHALDDANPFDFDKNEVIDISDAGTFLGKFPGSVSLPGSERYNFDHYPSGTNNVIDISDAGIFLGKFPGTGTKTIVFTNNTGQAVNDIHIEFFTQITKIKSTVPAWALQGATPLPNWQINLGPGGANIANGGTLTLGLNARRVPVVRCYDWTLDGVVVNGSLKPCTFRNATGGSVNDLHLEFKNPIRAYQLRYPPLPAALTWFKWALVNWLTDINIDLSPNSVANNSDLSNRVIAPGRVWELDCWYWTLNSVQVGPTYGTCTP
jgi:hypothetical protein